MSTAVLGIVVAVVVIAIVGYFLVRKKGKKSSQGPETPSSPPFQPPTS
ncbi:hypothetical protein IH779_02210 [Patescibacteria group bacterium]|nr:hypothetical protein [Patescibacteria group bacterium]